MMDFQAAIGIHQVARAESNWVRREAIWNTYQDTFGELPVHFPADSAKHMRHTYHLYTLLIGSVSRNLLLERMTARQIGVGVHYLSIPEHSFYQQAYGWRCE
jgi:dTDP-4-amino-4,6-dideoxygalactose transaminase